MASQKDKLLESAQKNILKGQLDKAIRDYQQIVALDPKYRQKLAELLVRAGNRDGAVAEYDIIAKGYADTCFYLKAIAVYKQIQKLDPDAIRINNNLATLYEKQGLAANAMAEYRIVYEYFERQGQYGEAVKILEKMQQVEPDNPSVLLKLAEVRYQSDNKELAYHEFKQLALLLRSRGDEDAFTGVCGRIGQLFPDKKDLMLELLSAEIDHGKAAGAIQTLHGLLRRDPSNLKILTLLVAAFRATGDLKNRTAAYTHILRHYPEELFPREGLIECAVEEGDLERSLELLRSAVPDFVARGGYETLEGFYLQLRTAAPADPRIVAGLADLYTAAGESDKAEAMSLLVPPSPDDEVIDYDGDIEELEVDLSDPAAADDGQGDDPAAVSVTPAPEPTAAALPMDAVPAVDAVLQNWEEEIILDLPDDLPAGVVPSVTELPDEPAPMNLAEGDDLAAEPAPAAILPETADIDGDAPVTDWAEEADFSTEPLAEAVSEDDDGDFVEVDFDFDDGDLDFLDGPELAAGSPDDGEIIYTFDELLSKFKEGVDRQLDKSDTENHYNLGIAYKEMGLWDEAVAEFRIASADPQRRADCLTLEGICGREKGDFSHAEQVFLEAGALDVLTAEELLSLSYELAVLYELTSRQDDAQGIYRELWHQRPDYRDVRAKVAGQGGAADEPEILEDLQFIDVENDET